MSAGEPDLVVFFLFNGFLLAPCLDFFAGLTNFGPAVVVNLLEPLVPEDRFDDDNDIDD